MAGVVPVIPRISFTDPTRGNGRLANGTVTVYLAGTTTLANTYQDKALTTLNTNPITLDANGEALFWVDDTYDYKFLLKDSGGATVTGWPVDDISTTGLGSFLQAGTGAVSRSAQSKMRDVVSVKDFGAVGDGVANDTAAINTAYAAASAANRALFVPAGSYLVSGLTFDQGINVLGENEQTKFLASSNGINIITITGGDRTPNKAYVPTIGNFVVWANGKTSCNGVVSYNVNGCNYENISVDGCAQGFRAQGDQYCTYTAIRARNCTIGIRMLDDTAGGTGGGNNNVWISSEAAVCEVGYLCGRPSAPFPLHTCSFINAVALSCTFTHYAVFGYIGLTFTNCSPESVISGTVATAYDGCTITPGLGYFNSAQVTLRDVTVATNGQTFTLANNSVVTFDNYGGANCSVVRDSTSIANFKNCVNPGNGSVIAANSIDTLIPGAGRATAFAFPNEVRYAANLTNHVLDPITIVNSAAINGSITAATEWHSALGICGSIVINDGTSNKGISPNLDGTAFSANSVFLIGLSVVANANCTLNVSYSGQVSVNFTLTANIPQRVYAVGGGSASGTLGTFNINIADTSGAKIYIGKAQLNVSSDTSYQDLFAQIMRSHLYNSKRSQGDVGILGAAPTVGTWSVGDVVYHRTPAASGNIGWVCVTAGSPGTWKSFGAIAA